ncbi:DUF6660 family protein [Flavobacteriaceae bacterium LMO-SS05]
MKILAFILSVYILALNFAPCEDSDAANDEAKTELSQHIDNDHTDLDLCSPFCQCQCCHVNVIDFNIADLKLQVSEISTELFFHIYGLEKSFNNTILQPPRV